MRFDELFEKLVREAGESPFRGADEEEAKRRRAIAAKEREEKRKKHEAEDRRIMQGPPTKERFALMIKRYLDHPEREMMPMRIAQTDISDGGGYGVWIPEYAVRMAKWDTAMQEITATERESGETKVEVNAQDDVGPDYETIELDVTHVFPSWDEAMDTLDETGWLEDYYDDEKAWRRAG